MSVPSGLDAKADAGGAVSKAWQLEQCRPCVSMELLAEGTSAQLRLPGSEKPEA